MERIIFKGKLLEVSLEDVRLPNGCLVRLERIRHPGAVLIIPFINSGTIVMLRQFRPVLKKYIYELPAGTKNKNEPDLACARRELLEETGYSAKKWKRLGLIYPVPGYSTEKITCFSARSLMEHPYSSEVDEVLESRFLTKGEIRKMFVSGLLVDAKTICALSMCGWL